MHSQKSVIKNLIFKQFENGKKWSARSQNQSFINGSTLLHTAAFFGHYNLVRRILNTLDLDGRPLEVDIRDYKCATALHRARSCDVIKLLVDSGADVNAVDQEGNTPLHARFFGERDEASELDAIQLLIYYKADFLVLNKKVL